MTNSRVRSDYPPAEFWAWLREEGRKDLELAFPLLRLQFWWPEAVINQEIT